MEGNCERNLEKVTDTIIQGRLEEGRRKADVYSILMCVEVGRWCPMTLPHVTF